MCAKVQHFILVLIIMLHNQYYYYNIKLMFLLFQVGKNNSVGRMSFFFVHFNFHAVTLAFIPLFYFGKSGEPLGFFFFLLKKGQKLAVWHSKSIAITTIVGCVSS